MPAEMLPTIHTEIGIPTAGQCLLFAAPILGVMCLYWLFRNSDRIIDSIFPNWEWEKKLGWFNLRANRRAEAIWRWMGYFVYALLAAALYGILWGSTAFADMAQQTPNTVADGMGKLTLLLVCFGFWLVYLGVELIPKLRDQYEREELEKYRAEELNFEEENPRLRKPTSPLSPKIEIWSRKPLPSPRQNPRR